MYGSSINLDSVENALLEQAREEIQDGRQALRRYRNEANFREVYLNTHVPYMGGSDYFRVSSALLAIAGIAHKLSMKRGDLLSRLSDLLEKHCDRFDRDFKALYTIHYGRIKALHDAKHAEDMARIDALLKRSAERKAEMDGNL